MERMVRMLVNDADFTVEPTGETIEATVFCATCAARLARQRARSETVEDHQFISKFLPMLLHPFLKLSLWSKSLVL